MNLDPLLDLALAAARGAGEAILTERERGLKSWKKEDGTKLSSADLASHKFICETLAPSKLDLISEEGDLTKFTAAKNAPFWLIDPLDGTSGFLRGGDEFCVMISLIFHGRPCLGVIYDPVKKNIFYAHEKMPVFKNEAQLKIDENIFEKNKNTALLSIHHLSAEDEEFAKKHNLRALNIGSGLKFAALLEGWAGVYKRRDKLNIWDLAAGDFLLNQSGGFMGDLEGKFLKYDPARSLRARPFIALSKKAYLEDFL